MTASELTRLYRAFIDADGDWSTFVICGKHHCTLGRSGCPRAFSRLRGKAERTGHVLQTGAFRRRRHRASNSGDRLQRFRARGGGGKLPYFFRRRVLKTIPWPT